jgi:hypothetical protein
MCLFITNVNGLNLVAFPPAKMIPFMNVYIF